MISCRRCLISSSTSTLFRPPRGLSLMRPSLMYWATIPLAMERFTPNVSATNYSLSLFYRNPISSWHFMQVYGTVEKDALMNRTAQRIREIVLSRFFSLYTGLWWEKWRNLSHTCWKIPSHHLFRNSCWLCNVFIWKKDFCEKNVKNTLLFV